MKNSLETRLGMFVALAIITTFILLEMVGGTGFFRKGYTVHALFGDARELQPGDQVKLAGVEVGNVESIDFAEDKVRISMLIREDVKLRTDSTAKIQFAGLMGQNYISLTFGDASKPALEEGSQIETIEQPDLSTLMARLENVAVGVENVTKTFSGDSIQNLLGPLTDFMHENNPKLSKIFANVSDISDRINKGEGTVGRLISDDTLIKTAESTVSTMETTAKEMQTMIGKSDSIFDDVKVTLEEARTTMSNARKIVTDVEAGKGTLGLLLKDEALYTETAASMKTLREILNKINEGKGSVGQLVNDDSLMKNVKMSLQKVDKATEGLEDQGPLSLLGTAVNQLF